MYRREQAEGSVLMSKEDAARSLGTTPRHAQRLAESGELPYYRVGRLIRFSSADIEEYLDRTRVESRRAD